MNDYQIHIENVVKQHYKKTDFKDPNQAVREVQLMFDECLQNIGNPKYKPIKKLQSTANKLRAEKSAKSKMSLNK